jgi:4-aminobutyrate aminotransferase-like enzyme
MLTAARRSARAAHTTASALQLLADHFSPAVPRAPKGNNIVCKTARGSWIEDVSGARYLDFQTGIGVANTGHSHPRCAEARARARPPVALARARAPLTPRRPLPPSARRVVAAITAQVQNGIHLQQNCMISEPVLELIEELKLIAPPGLSRFFFNCARSARALAVAALRG